jgi:Xaa-Pro aminopeptidase
VERRSTVVDEIVAKQKRAMAEEGLHALIAASPDNVTYTAGFEVPSQYALIRERPVFCLITHDGNDVMIVPDMEENFAVSESRLRDVRAYNEFTEDPADLLADAVDECGLSRGRIGIEMDFVPIKYFARLKERLPDVRFVDDQPLYARLREIKTVHEIDLLRRAGKIAERAHHDAAVKASEGMTEMELAQLITASLYAQGLESVRKVIVGSGERSEYANPGPTQRQLRRGDLIRVDIFGKIAGYTCDVARTYVVGKSTSEQKSTWQKLHETRNLVLGMIRPGVRTGKIYDAFAKRFEELGLTPINFVGHGLGISVHEMPYIGRYGDATLEQGMVLCVEPYYTPQGQGYQVEDELVVTADGYELITDYRSTESLIEIA